MPRPVFRGAGCATTLIRRADVCLWSEITLRHARIADLSETLRNKISFIINYLGSKLKQQETRRGLGGQFDRHRRARPPG
jgi:hypothetical protein